MEREGGMKGETKKSGKGSERKNMQACKLATLLCVISCSFFQWMKQEKCHQDSYELLEKKVNDQKSIKFIAEESVEV